MNQIRNKAELETLDSTEYDLKTTKRYVAPLISDRAKIIVD